MPTEQLPPLDRSFSGIDGFLGTRGSVMLDVVFVAMFAIVPLMAWAIYLARYRQQYRWHRNIQVTLGVVLLVAVTAFEIDMRFFTDWRERAEPSRFYQLEGPNWVWISLLIHLLFAIPTPFLWIFVIVQGLRKFARPPLRNDYSSRHVYWGRWAALGMLLTAVTGCVFYWLAFVC